MDHRAGSGGHPDLPQYRRAAIAHRFHTFSGWLYLNLDNADEFIDSIIDCVEVVKDEKFEFGRLMYFKDPNGYTIGVNQIRPLD
ncbi:hypothetical protein F5544_11000 [Nocardia arthritidis]|uniref:VOC domain-containing protein n=1 Tax=Nocardia arthritidis TaxID=228602 RepID=A0A6G9Y9Z8_9NOCA|nr:hypothetical protein F5544_11000 [Nocardia arthritidis]